MSKKCQAYTVDDVNKKIIAKPEFVRSKSDYLGPQNRYRDEEQAIYKAKRQQFNEAAKKYKDENKTVYTHTRDKLDKFSNDFLRYYPECECEAEPRGTRCYEDVPNTTGLLLRKRTERRIHEENNAKLDTCSLEPWFMRYIRLCKFIYAARTIILKNRLLKRLEILKKLDKFSVEAYESGHIKYENVSYPHLFEKFITD